MMPDQKGRSGKKPKYQIPDIGGAGQTAEDISTERVLNFLIKGESTPREPADSSNAADGGDGSHVSDTSPQSVHNQPSGTSLSSQEAPPKKSLARLFERAKSGGVVAKGQSLNLPAPTEAESLAQSTTHAETAQPVEDSRQVAVPASAVEEPVKEKESVSPAAEKISPASPELAHYVELWKNFYRLKSGEVEALSTMYRLSHEQGLDYCYIKMHNLAEMSNLTYRYCQKIIRSLEQLGWITKVKDYDPADQQGVLYRVNLNPSNPLSSTPLP
jgi:hypothetical protein